MMEEILQFFKDYGNLISVGLIISLAGMVTSMLQAAMKKKQSEIDLLRTQIESLSEFSIENVVEKFRALKEYYEQHVRDWREASVRTLEEARQKAIEEKEAEFQRRIEEEIDKRNKLAEAYSNLSGLSAGLSLRLSIHDIAGTYTVVGYNPGGSLSRGGYVGKMIVSVTGDILEAVWSIGPSEQKHHGTGVLVGSSLAFVFVGDMSHYQEGAEQTGVVLYEFITKDVLRGYWTVLPFQFGGRVYTPSEFGFEEMRRANEVD